MRDYRIQSRTDKLVIAGFQLSIGWTIYDIAQGTSNKLIQLQGRLLDLIVDEKNEVIGIIARESFTSESHIEVWNASTHKLLKCFPLRHVPVKSAHLSRDGRYIALGMLHRIAVADLSSDVVTPKYIEVNEPEYVRTLKFTEDNQSLFWGGHSRAVNVLNLETNKSRTLFEVEGFVEDIQMHKTSYRLAVASTHYTQIWDFDANRIYAQTPTTIQNFGTLHFSPDGSRLAINNCYDHPTIWTIKTDEVQRIEFDDLYFVDVHFTSDKQSIIVIDEENQIHVLDSRTLDTISTISLQ